MSNKQTAIEWLIEQLKEREYAGEFPPHLLFEQAKEMEKEQMYYSYLQGIVSNDIEDETANETFKSE